MSVVSSAPQSIFMQSRHEYDSKLCSNKWQETRHNFANNSLWQTIRRRSYIKKINNKPIYPLMQVERLSVNTRMESRSYSFSFYLERWQPPSCLIQEVHLWHISLSLSLFHQHALYTLYAARCFLPTQHLFDLIRSQEIDGCSIIVKITHRKSLSPLHP